MTHLGYREPQSPCRLRSSAHLYSKQLQLVSALLIHAGAGRQGQRRGRHSLSDRGPFPAGSRRPAPGKNSRGRVGQPMGTAPAGWQHASEYAGSESRDDLARCQRRQTTALGHGCEAAASSIHMQLLQLRAAAASLGSDLDRRASQTHRRTSRTRHKPVIAAPPSLPRVSVSKHFTPRLPSTAAVHYPQRPLPSPQPSNPYSFVTLGIADRRVSVCCQLFPSRYCGSSSDFSICKLERSKNSWSTASPHPLPVCR